MEGHSIQWDASQVEPVGEFYELRVTVNETGVSEAWADGFNERAVREYRKARRQPWGMISTAGTTVLVQDLEPGAEQALIDHLTTLVEETDRALSGHEQGDSKSEAAPTSDRWESAAELAERFRSAL